MFDLKENISLSPFTSFHLGGPARYFSEVKSLTELAEAVAWAKANGQKTFILGGGSNVLVSDQGFDGLVMRLKLEEISLGEDKTSLKAEAGVRLAQVVNFAAHAGLTGLEWAAGIPGTIGGAVAGNAGAFGGEMKDCVEQLEIWNVPRGQKETLTGQDGQFGYRTSRFKKDKEQIILAVTLRLAPGQAEEIKKQGAANIAKRMAKQPQGALSAGSFFKNPVVKDAELIAKFEKSTGMKMRGGKIPAGWLIDQAELTGKKIDGAMVSLGHGNFIVNTGSAKAENIIILASLIKQQVRNRFGVELEEEVEYIGF